MDLSPTKRGDITKAGDNTILVEFCRACSARYDFKLTPEVTVSVLCGRPSDSVIYKAISYLWELDQSSKVYLECRNCKALRDVPVRDCHKLRRILNFVSNGETFSCSIWLDALSIDQKNPDDLKSQLAVMGSIYQKSQMVSVLLPLGDEGAFMTLRKLAVLSQEIINHVPLQNSAYLAGNWIGDDVTFGHTAEAYNMAMNLWITKLSGWKYWRRAWTFQEWAMASELEIGCESPSENQIMMNFKNIIIMAASLVGNWKNAKARAGMSQDRIPGILRAREEVGAFLNQVRLHFPLQDFPVADNESSASDLRKQTFITGAGSALDSGTYISAVAPAIKRLNTRTMLSLALNAINMTPRTASYEADRVASWASMCNITYNYDKNDSFPVALHKVITTVRRNGLRVYNFHANTVGGETDLLFMKYAAAMKKSNSQSLGFVFGSSVFSGRTDTLTHIQYSLEQTSDTLTHLASSFDVQLQEVKGFVIMPPISWADRDNVLEAMASLVAGKVKGDNLRDVVPGIKTYICSLSSKQLARYILVSISIEIINDPTIYSFTAWAICPSSIDMAKLFVARETLNGTLVLATPASSPSARFQRAQIVAYLNISHQRDGTYLIQSDTGGIVDIIFRPIDNPLMDWNIPDLPEETSFLGLDLRDTIDDRMMNVQIALGDTSFPVVAADHSTWLHQQPHDLTASQRNWANCPKFTQLSLQFCH